MTPRRSADRPSRLVGPMLIALVLCLALSVTGSVLMVQGRAWGSVVTLAGLALPGVFHRWSRRQWDEHRRPD